MWSLQFQKERCCLMIPKTSYIFQIQLLHYCITYECCICRWKCTGAIQLTCPELTIERLLFIIIWHHILKNRSHVIMHTIMAFHILKSAGWKQIVFYSALKSFVDLLFCVLYHCWYMLASLSAAVLLVLRYMHLHLMRHSLFYKSDSGFLQSLSFHFPFLFIASIFDLKTNCKEHRRHQRQCADFFLSGVLQCRF